MAEEQPNDVQKTISIAILLCGYPSKSTTDKFGSYDNMIRHLLTEALASIPRYEWHPKISLYLRSFNVVMGEFPEISELDEGKWDAMILTGTPESCTQENVIWIDVLRKYITHVVEVHPLVRIIGLCFGHQLIAQAFGGQVVQDHANAELGVLPFNLTEEGTKLLSPFDQKKVWRLEQLHYDSVKQLPKPIDDEPWELVGSSEQVPVQGLALRYATEAPPLPSSVKTSSYIAFDVEDSTTSATGPLAIRHVHVFSLQAHPEFNTAVTQTELTALHDSQQMDEATYRAAYQRAGAEQDGLETARMILAMLGVEPALAEENLSM